MPTIDRRELAAIFAGGCAGALARVALAELLPSTGASWPWATFIANIAGAFLLGGLAIRPRAGLPLSYGAPLLGTGFCGALTTFSTLQLETLRMIDSGRILLAVAYVGASVVAGLFAVRLATNLGRRAEGRT